MEELLATIGGISVSVKDLSPSGCLAKEEEVRRRAEVGRILASSRRRRRRSRNKRFRKIVQLTDTFTHSLTCNITIHHLHRLRRDQLSWSGTYSDHFVGTCCFTATHPGGLKFCGLQTSLDETDSVHKPGIQSYKPKRCHRSSELSVTLANQLSTQHPVPGSMFSYVQSTRWQMFLPVYAFNKALNC